MPLSPSASQPELHGWPLPAGLDQTVEDFREWLRSLLWELSHLLAQVGSNSLHAVWTLTDASTNCHAHGAVSDPRLLRGDLHTAACCGTSMQLRMATPVDSLTKSAGCSLSEPLCQHSHVGLPLQRREQRSAVWSSVLGCLLHLCTYNGRLVRAFLEGLSLRAVRALLHCSLRDHWAPDVHRQLVALAAALMYVPQEEQPGERRLPFAVSPRGEHFCRCCDPREHK